MSIYYNFVLLTAYLFCLVDVFFNRRSAFLWVLKVFPFPPTYCFIRMRQTSYMGFLRKSEKKLARFFNFMFRYIDDVLSLNNCTLCHFVDRIYAIELEIKNTPDTARFASYLDLYPDIDSEIRLRTKLYDKRDYLNFSIMNFPFKCRTFQQHLYMEYISLI